MTTKSEAPRTRYTFVCPWDEVQYLYYKVLYWSWGKNKKWLARPFAARLEAVLPTVSPKVDPIRFFECYALVHEFRGDLQKVLEYREKEIAQVKKWFRAMGPPDRKDYGLFLGYEDLADRHILIAMFYDNFGDLKKARQHLQAAKRLARNHGFIFTGEDFLSRVKELIAEDKKIEQTRPMLHEPNACLDRRHPTHVSRQRR